MAPQLMLWLDRQRPLTSDVAVDDGDAAERDAVVGSVTAASAGEGAAADDGDAGGCCRCGGWR